MVKVIQADLVNDRRLRNVIDGEAELLVGFDQYHWEIRDDLFVPFVEPLIELQGEISVAVDPFVPK
jgi:hypothetical protein